jgi:hypothetical protein
MVSLVRRTKAGRVPRCSKDPVLRSQLLTAPTRSLVNGFQWSTGSAPAGAIMCSCNCQAGCGGRYPWLQPRLRTMTLGWVTGLHQRQHSCRFEHSIRWLYSSGRSTVARWRCPMQLAIARRPRTNPSHRMRLLPPRIWRELPPEHQVQVAHVLAVLVRRVHRAQDAPNERA